MKSGTVEFSDLDGKVNLILPADSSTGPAVFATPSVANILIGIHVA